MLITHGFHATMTTAPGKADEVINLLLHAPSLPNEDCVVFIVSRSASEENTVHVTEGWTSVEAHQRFFTSEPAQQFVARLQALLVGESQYTDETPIGGKAAFAQ